jgi:two-component system, chemotaxis family, response regulator Rcp1
VGGPEPARPVSVLIVEDNPADVWLIQESLRQAELPHDSKVIDDGEEACKFLNQCATDGGAPDVVILDLNIPRVDGAAILSLMEANRSLRETPVAILSSSRAPNDIALAGKLQNATYIVKPSDLDAFLDIGKQIRNLLLQTRNAIDDTRP